MPRKQPRSRSPARLKEQARKTRVDEFETPENILKNKLYGYNWLKDVVANYIAQ